MQQHKNRPMNLIGRFNCIKLYKGTASGQKSDFLRRICNLFSDCHSRMQKAVSLSRSCTRVLQAGKKATFCAEYGSPYLGRFENIVTLSNVYVYLPSSMPWIISQTLSL